MPRNVMNKIQINGTEEQVQEVFRFLQDDEMGAGSIDFRKITPMPQWVYGSSPDEMEFTEETEMKWGEENLAHGWGKLHWGTKWNAYGLADKRNGQGNAIHFQTAWDGIPTLMQKIAWIFPDIEVEYWFASEDIGSSGNGYYRFRKEKTLEKRTNAAFTKEAYEFWFDVWGGMPAYIRYNSATDNYEHLSEEEYDY